MGLDLYAGTLTRYYSRNWKTTVQQWAEENGYAFNRMGPAGPMEQAGPGGGPLRHRKLAGHGYRSPEAGRYRLPLLAGEQRRPLLHR